MPSRRARTLVQQALLCLTVGSAIACGGGDSSGGGITRPPGNSDPVTPVPPVAASITVSRNALQLSGAGDTQALSAEVRDQAGAVLSNYAVTWTSSNSQIATVSSGGVVTAVTVGSATVTASAGSVSANVAVTVGVSAASLTISPSSVTLTGAGATQQLTATARDASGRTVEAGQVLWQVSPSSVATVSTSGLITAVASGSATVTAIAGAASASVQVLVQSTVGPAPCTNRTAFSDYLFDPSLIKVVTQIGIIGGGNTEIIGRSYVFPIDGQDGVRMPLTAPTALNVVAARHYLPPGAPTTGYVPDWSLLLDTGCGITIELFHVKDVAPSIKAVADTTISNSSAWQQLSTRVPFEAGATFGWYQRGLNSVAFDVIAHDNTVRNKFTNQARYETGHSNLLDIVCPWNLFESNKRDAYLATMGAQTGFRVAGAGCGTIERDVAGTPAGQWFRSQAVQSSMPFGKDGDYGDPLPIVFGVDSTVYIGHTGPTNDIRIANNNPTWRNPASITTSHCYQIISGSTSSGWLWLRMNSETQMDVSYSNDGLCPTAFPATGFVSYYR